MVEKQVVKSCKAKSIRTRLTLAGKEKDMAPSGRYTVIYFSTRHVNQRDTDPWAAGFHLEADGAEQTESPSSPLIGAWREPKDTEHFDTEEEIQVRELMESVKRYIRNIDISEL